MDSIKALTPKRVLAILLVMALLLTMVPQLAFAAETAYSGEQGKEAKITLKDTSSVSVSDIITDSDIEDYYYNTIKTALDYESDLRFAFSPTGSSTQNAAEADIIANTLPHIKIYRAEDALTGENPIAAYEGGNGTLLLEQIKFGTASTSEAATVQLLVKVGTLQADTEYALVFDKGLGVKKAETTIEKDIVFYFKTKASVSGLALDKTSISTTIGQAEILSATFDKGLLDSEQVEWTSSNEAVASVENGKVKAISEGSAVITAKYQGQEVTCAVKVGTIAYGMQGIGGNQFSIIQPDNITVLSEDDERYLNKINTSFHDDADIDFVVKMSAGMQNFNEENFIDENMDCIKVYDAYGGNVLAQNNPESGQVELQYAGYETETGIKLRIAQGNLEKGTYYLVVGKQLVGNNPDKILGKDIVFQFKITDPNESVEPEGVSLNWEELTLTKGAQLQLKASVLPEDTTDKTVLWSSSSEEIVSVDEAGNIAALAAGTAEITVQTKNGKFSASCSVTVEDSSLTLNSFALDMSLNEEATLRAYANDERVMPQWESSAPEVVTVDEKGNLKALASGHAVITATVGDARALCVISVTSQGDYGWQGVNGNSMLMTSPGNIYVKEITNTCYYNGINTPIDGSQEIVFGFTMSAGINNFNRDNIFTINNMPRIKVYDKYPDGNILAQYNNTAEQAKIDMQEYDGSRIIYVTIPKEALKNGTYYLTFDKALCGNNLNKTLGKDVVFQFTVQWSVDNLTVEVPEEGSSLEAAVRSHLNEDQTLADIETLHIITKDDATLTEADFQFIREQLGETLTWLDLNQAALTGNKLAQGALEGCTGLERVTLPPETTVIQAKAFYGCTALTTLELTGQSPPELEDASALEGTELSQIVVPSELETIYQTASPWKNYGIIVEVTGIELDKTIEVERGKEVPLTAVISPANATNKEIEWTSNDKGIAVVDQQGVVSGIKDGETRVNAITKDGGYKASCKIEVIPPHPTITLNQDRIQLFSSGTNSTFQLVPEVTGNDDYTEEDVTWSCESFGDSTVAQVDENGLVTGISAGTAVVIAYVETQRVLCVVTVKEHTISLNTGTAYLLTTGTGNTATLKASIDGTAVAGTQVNWSTSNSSVVSVTRTGIITGKKVGTAVITAEANGKTVSCKVTVGSLGKPTIKGSSAAYNKTQVSWTGVSGASGYILSRCTKAGTVQKSWTLSASARSYAETGRTTGTAYYYKVCAYKTVNGTRYTGNYSAIVSATPVPAKPTGVKTAKGGSKKIKVSWKKVSGASGYVVYRSTKKTTGYKAVKTIKSAKTVKYTTGKLKKGTTYYFKVRAYRTVKGKKVYGSYSAIVSRKAK